MKLNEVAATKSGLVLNRKKASLQSNIKRKYSVVSLKSFNSNGIYDYNESEIFIAEEELKEDYIARKGDVLVRLREPINAIYIDKNYEDLIISSLMAVIRVDENKISPQYLTHYINSDVAQKQFLQDVTQTAVKMVKISDIQNLDINVPTIEKQKLIVETMNTFNKEEVLLNKLIAEKQNLKKLIFNTTIEGIK